MNARAVPCVRTFARYAAAILLISWAIHGCVGTYRIHRWLDEDADNLRFIRDHPGFASRDLSSSSPALAREKAKAKRL